MNGNTHKKIAESAFQVLPDWGKHIIADYKNILIETSNYPDIFDNPLTPLSEKERIDHDFRRYCFLPDNTTIHTQGNHNVGPGKNFYLLTHYLNKIIENLHGNNIEEAVKFAGCLSHYIGDSAQPIHLVDLRIISELLPKPENWPPENLHTEVESITGDVEITDYQPQILGESVAEIVFNLIETCQQMISINRAQITPIIQAMYKKQKKTYLYHTTIANTSAAKVVADILHSVFCLVFDRINAQEREKLSVRDLRLLTPTEIVIDMLYNHQPIKDANMFIYSHGKTVPLKLKEKVFSKGLGVLTQSTIAGEPISKLVYRIPRGIYSRFQSVAGLNPELNKEGMVRFQIIGDDRILFDSGSVSADSPANYIDLDIKSIETLTLLVKEASQGEILGLRHAVWAEPKLIK